MKNEGSHWEVNLNGASSIVNDQSTSRCEYTYMQKQKPWWTIQYIEQIIILRKPIFFHYCDIYQE